MSYILITGSGGLIGSEAVERFLDEGHFVIGVDNNMREYFFGLDGSVNKKINDNLDKKNYFHYYCDIRDYDSL